MLGFILGLLTTLHEGAPAAANSLPHHLLDLARRGDRAAQDEIIRRFTPLVLRVGAQVTGRYLEIGRDEEVSVGLLALKEAIDRYDPERGASFVTFAEVVLRRRLIDFRRRDASRAEVPLSELTTTDEEGSQLAGVEEREALVRFAADQEAADRREEIQRYSARLADFGIRFTDLVSESPRHADARERAIACAHTLAADPLLAEHLRTRRELPLKVLETRVGVSRKTLERQRRYIIAVTLLLLDDFMHLRRYVALDGQQSGGGGLPPAPGLPGAG